MGSDSSSSKSTESDIHSGAAPRLHLWLSRHELHEKNRAMSKDLKSQTGHDQFSKSERKYVNKGNLPGRPDSNGQLLRWHSNMRGCMN